MAETDYFEFDRRWWVSTTAVRRLSLAEKGFALELACLMAVGNPPGTLTDENGKPLSRAEVIRLTGTSESEAVKMLETLLNAGVIVRESGTRLLLDPRMRRRGEIREARRQSGVQGGSKVQTDNYTRPGFVYVIKRVNDGAVKIGVTKNLHQRLYQLRHKSTVGEIELIGFISADNMIEVESQLHAEFARYRQSDNWYAIPVDELILLVDRLDTDFQRGSQSTSQSQKSLSTHIPEDWWPSDDEFQRLLDLADVLWSAITMDERRRKVEQILTELVNYWTELKILDKQHGTSHGKKRDWYLTARRRMQEVSFRERRLEMTARNSADFARNGVSNANAGQAKASKCVMCEAAKNDDSLPPCHFHGKE